MEKVLNAHVVTLADAKDATVKVWKKNVQPIKNNSKKLFLQPIKENNSKIFFKVYKKFIIHQSSRCSRRSPRTRRSRARHCLPSSLTRSWRRRRRRPRWSSKPPKKNSRISKNSTRTNSWFFKKTRKSRNTRHKLLITHWSPRKKLENLKKTWLEQTHGSLKNSRILKYENLQKLD